MYEVSITSEPTGEPVTLTELKAHLRVDSSLDDTELGDKLSEARKSIEQMTNRAFFTQTRTLSFSHFDYRTDRIYLPGAPVASISNVAYVDLNGTNQVWDSTEYNLVAGEPSYLQLAYNENWPDHRGTRDRIIITYVCGKDDVADIDVRVKAACKLHVELNYDREELRDKGADRIQVALDSLVNQLRIGDEFQCYA
jgi:uncharacterized phiE125 gp8 family phage protein